MRPVIALALSVLLLANAREGDAQERLDFIEFRNGDKLTGTVEGIDAKGNVNFQPKLAVGNVLVPCEGVEMVRFGARISKTQAHGGSTRKLEVTPDTVALWHMDEGKGEVIRDSSGNGNHGAIHGARWVEGRFGYALEFDGDDDYAQVPNSASLDVRDSVTIEAWVRPNFYGRSDSKEPIRDDSTSANILAKMATARNYTGPFWFEYRNRGDMNVYFKNSKNKSVLPIIRDLPVDAWSYIAATYEARTATGKVYLNGFVVDTKTVPNHGQLKPGVELVLGTGKGSRDHGHYFNGAIDEIAIYDRALSPEEIFNHYGGELKERICLVDGSIIRGKVEALEDGKMRLNIDYAGVVIVEKEWIDKLVFYPSRAASDDKDIPEDNTDTIHLGNGDKLSGTVRRITKDKLVVSGDYGSLEIDRDNIADIIFAKVKKEKVFSEGVKLNARFVTGDKILGILLGLDEQYLRLKVGFCKEIRAARWALRKLEFKKKGGRDRGDATTAGSYR